MITKKICLLGTNAVGKTSLTRQFVDSIFSDDYHTTIGVKIDKKVVDIKGEPLTLILWDIHGEDSYQKVQKSYLRGTAGYILVVDSTRPDTLDMALELRGRVEEHVGPVPYVLALNKSDLIDDWTAMNSRLGTLADTAVSVVKTSAKSGDGVEEAFLRISESIVLRHAA